MGFKGASATDPSLITPQMPQGNPFLQMAKAKKQAESAQPNLGQPEPESKQYDPTGKTKEQIMAETGRQSELDKMGSQLSLEPSQPEPQQFIKPLSSKEEQTLAQTGQTVSMQPLEQAQVEQSEQNIPMAQVNQAQQAGTPAKLPQPEAQGNLGENVQITARANQPYLGGRINRGTDFAGEQGTPVSLPKGEWEVLDARNDIKGRTPENFTASSNYGWGNSVKVKNAETGEVMRLSHMQYGSVPDLKPGQTIEGGKVIGAIGNTGNTHGKTGNHLDVEYYDSKGNRRDVAQTQYAASLFSGKEKYQPVSQQEAQQQLFLSPQQNELLKQETPEKQSGFQTVDQMLGLNQPQQQPQPQPQQNYESIIKTVPESQRKQAKTAIPQITNALKEQGITDPNAVAYALATAGHESGFVPKEEVMAQRGINSHNDYIAKLQDNYEGGKKYRGRGYIQLTHKGNYKKYGDMIGEDLVNNPEKANDPEVAAKILAAYIKENGIDKLASQGNYDQARVKVQGKGALNNQFIDTTRQIGQQANKWSQYL